MGKSRGAGPVNPNPHNGEIPVPFSADVDDSTESTPPRLEFHSRAKFWWKTGLLLLTFVALIPILLYQSVLGAKVYLWFLGIVHIIGTAVFVIGVRKEDIAPTARGFWGRVAGLVTIGLLIYLASKGLQTEFGSLLFWGSLFAVWAIHTLGLLLLHLRGRHDKNCPFV